MIVHKKDTVAECSTKPIKSIESKEIVSKPNYTAEHQKKKKKKKKKKTKQNVEALPYLNHPAKKNEEQKDKKQKDGEKREMERVGGCSSSCARCGN